MMGRRLLLLLPSIDTQALMVWRVYNRMCRLTGLLSLIPRALPDFGHEVRRWMHLRVRGHQRLLNWIGALAVFVRRKVMLIMLTRLCQCVNWLQWCLPCHMKLILLFKILLIIIFINSAPVQIKYFSTILLYFSLLLAQRFYFLEFLVQLLQFGVGDVLLLFLLLHL